MEAFYNEQGGTTSQPEEELLIGLACLQLDNTTAAVTTRGDTREAQERRAKFKVIPRETRLQARQKRAAQEAEKVEKEPEKPPQPASPVPSPQRTPTPPPLEAPRQSPPPSPLATQQQSPPPSPPLPISPSSPVSENRDSAMDIETLEPQEEEQQQLCRGHSEELERMETILRDTARLVEAQQGDPLLGPIRNCLLYTSPSPRDATLSRMPSSA